MSGKEANVTWMVGCSPGMVVMRVLVVQGLVHRLTRLVAGRRLPFVRHQAAVSKSLNKNFCRVCIQHIKFLICQQKS